jgi:hypothetical protein
MEKIEFSLEDLGRLAAFMDGMPGHPLDVFKEWVRVYALSEEEGVLAQARIEEGYAQEMDLIRGDGPLRKPKRAKT